MFTYNDNEARKMRIGLLKIQKERLNRQLLQIESQIAALTKTPRQVREETISKAKKDVENIVRNNEGNLVFKVSGNVIVAIDTDYSRAKDIDSADVGIAICATGDTFNEYVGKAIAARRALGMSVPEHYLNMPQG